MMCHDARERWKLVTSSKHTVCMYVQEQAGQSHYLDACRRDYLRQPVRHVKRSVKRTLRATTQEVCAAGPIPTVIYMVAYMHANFT